MSLASLQDWGFEPPAGWSPAGLRAAEQKRLRRELLTALASSQIPRRLGGSAGVDVRVDHKLGRRVANVYKVLLQQHGVEVEDWDVLKVVAGRDSLARAEGAVRDWPTWHVDQQNWLAQRVGHVARWAVKNSGLRVRTHDKKHVKGVGNRLVARLQEEQKLLADVFGKTLPRSET